MEAEQLIFLDSNIDGVSIVRLVNEPVDSNCFILFNQKETSCIIVDPGSKDSGNLLSCLYKLSIYPEWIILTHEHFDHIWGLQKIKEKFPDCKIIASSNCAERIVHRKKNMSVFYDQVGFEAPKADIVLGTSDRYRFWNLIDIDFFEAKGHSDASICFSLGNDLFVGDVMIKGYKTATKFPNGSMRDLQITLKNLFEKFIASETRVFPGHGPIFQLCEVLPKDFL